LGLTHWDWDYNGDWLTGTGMELTHWDWDLLTRTVMAHCD